HALKVQSGTESRSMLFTVTAGETLSEYIALAPQPTPQITGRLDVTSSPLGAEVRVDGMLKGRTPVIIDALTSGSHNVVIGTGDAAVNRTVRVVPGATASIVASNLGPATTGGWIRFRTPIEFEVFEANRRVGTTAVDRLMLPGGEHQLDLV